MNFVDFFSSNDMCSDELNASLDNDYDAVNNETFGVSSNNAELYDDLEELSKIVIIICFKKS